MVFWIGALLGGITGLVTFAILVKIWKDGGREELELRKSGISFEPRDIWVGVYWKYSSLGYNSYDTRLRYALRIWICTIPMLPVHLYFHWYKGRAGRVD